MVSISYLRKSLQSSSSVGEFTLAGLLVVIKDPLPKTINVKECLSIILERMPRNLFSNIKKIMIGQFDFLEKRSVQAVYRNGIIYITNEHEDNYDFMSDIIHEIAHAFEERNSKQIYSDGTLKQEFLLKREALYKKIISEGSIPIISKNYFLKCEYDLFFDNYLYNIIGYKKLTYLTSDIFVSPYAATSLREYFANAFENFFINDMVLVHKYAPTVYKKLLNFMEM